MDQRDDLRVEDPVIRNQVGNAKDDVRSGQSDQEALGPEVRIETDEPGQHIKIDREKAVCHLTAYRHAGMSAARYPARQARA